MLVLGLDTATVACTVAVCDDGALLAESTVLSPRAHSAVLMTLIDQVVAASGRSKQDLAGVAVGVGPGSFTGLRIGLATAMAIAFALDIPCVPVGTLTAMAVAALPGGGWVAPVLDARRGEAYAGLYRSGGTDDPSGLVEVEPPCIEPLASFLSRLPETAGQVVFTGDACGVHRAAIVAALGARAAFAPEGFRWPRGWSVAAVGLEQLRRGKSVSPDVLAPLYLRPTEIERRVISGS